MTEIQENTTDQTDPIVKLNPKSRPAKRAKRLAENPNLILATQSSSPELIQQRKQESIILHSNYLSQWLNEKKIWKFNKNKQTWILKNLYDKEMLSKKDFKTALLYLAKLQGGSAIKSTLEQARNIKKEYKLLLEKQANPPVEEPESKEEVETKEVPVDEKEQFDDEEKEGEEQIQEEKIANRPKSRKSKKAIPEVKKEVVYTENMKKRASKVIKVLEKMVDPEEKQ